jgi:hypothetical protein
MGICLKVILIYLLMELWYPLYKERDIMKKHVMYKGYKFTYDRGYYNNATVGKLHRYKWMIENNQVIPPDYIIHHIDFDKENNELDNLQLMTTSQHNSLHGQNMIEETKRKISESRKGMKFTDEHKDNLSKAAKTRPPMTEETREKFSLASTGRLHTEETKAKMSDIARNRPPMSKEARDKIGEANKKRVGRKLSEEAKHKIRDAAKKQWERKLAAKS